MDIIQYLNDYIVSNDPKIINNIPTFIDLAIKRVNKKLRGTFLETFSQSVLLPVDFTAMRYVTVNSVQYKYNVNANENTFNIAGGKLLITPPLEPTDLLEYVYYRVSQEALTDNAPSILVHGAAAEALMFEGNLEDAALETQLFNTLIDESNGWDTQGTISIGGDYNSGGIVPSGNEATSNVWGFLTGDINNQIDLQQQFATKANATDLTSHTNNTSNPHNVTASQVGAISSADLTAHTSNTSNPHVVTAAQVGAYTTAQTDTLLSAKANDSAVVHLTGNETVAGIKTFSSNPLSSAAQSTSANALTRKDYVDSLIGSRAGELFDFAGTVAPSYALALPKVPTNISRTTYAELFGAIGTTWGVGDGSTTFGMPYMAADEVGLCADGNVGTAYAGLVQTHNHGVAGVTSAGNVGGPVVSVGNSSGVISSAPVNSGGSLLNSTTKNLAAGVYVLKCVRIR